MTVLEEKQFTLDEVEALMLESVRATIRFKNDHGAPIPESIISRALARYQPRGKYPDDMPCLATCPDGNRGTIDIAIIYKSNMVNQQDLRPDLSAPYVSPLFFPKDGNCPYPELMIDGVHWHRGDGGYTIAFWDSDDGYYFVFQPQESE